MPPKLTDAQRDAIDALTRKIVTGSADTVVLVESAGDMQFPESDQGMSEEELVAFRAKFLPNVA